jgi:hypothetical protein
MHIVRFKTTYASLHSIYKKNRKNIIQRGVSPEFLFLCFKSEKARGKRWGIFHTCCSLSHKLMHIDLWILKISNVYKTCHISNFLPCLMISHCAHKNLDKSHQIFPVICPCHTVQQTSRYFKYSNERWHCNCSKCCAISLKCRISKHTYCTMIRSEWRIRILYIVERINAPCDISKSRDTVRVAVYTAIPRPCVLLK